ncbi:MAG: multicopper oxidase family protein [Gemmatimonadales bacterium]|nr:multicopper oxidase family protein [Gemmatimonadales bacterium]
MLARFLFAAMLAAAPAAAQEPCTVAPGSLGASRDLYCIELLPGAAADSASGTAQLDWIEGPFTVAVAADGTHRWRITFRLKGLPPVTGPRPGYVAWAAPPSMSPMVKLGVVREGMTRTGALAFDRFYLLVTAEPDTLATERHGAVLLRGESAGNRMRPADTYQYFLGALSGSDPHQHHATTDSLGWTPVPMYPGLEMLPSEMALRPETRAWSPPDDPHIPPAVPRRIVRLAGGDTLELSADLVRRTIAGRTYTMFGFNGQYPGPLLEVSQSASITVRFTNQLPLPSTVHWHGLRLENRFDGVPGLTQPEVPPGGSFVYTLRFPDTGIYWYHPHVREDIQQDLGLYGNIFVKPPAGTFGPAHREAFLILDDILIGENGPVPYGAESATHAAMGRFGNTFLVNGEPAWRLNVRRGEVVRLYLTNASNTRTFNASFGPGARMKVVGSDLGAFAREEWVESVVIAPAERYVVDVRFERPGRVALLNRVRALDHLNGRFFSRTDTLGVVTVSNTPHPAPRTRFDTLRTSPAAAELARFLAGADRPVDRTLELRVDFAGLPFVSAQLMRLDSIFFNPVEWDGTMPGMNWATTARQAHWALRDPATGLENMDVRWRYRVGDMVRIRLVGARNTLHGMQHPIHLHGQRFVILAVNGIRNQNPAWKDTALVPAGGSVDLLVEMSNPGRWMLHCHIAEHLQSGMMMALDVEEP